MTSKIFKSIFINIFIFGSVLIAPSVTFSQTNYPDRPVTLIVGNTPGSSVDAIARKFAEKLSTSPTFGQSVVVVNRAGAGGLIGLQLLAKAPKDGYTLSFYGNTVMIVPHLYKDIGYDPIKDITTVAIGGSIPFVAVTHPSSKIRSIEDLIQMAKMNPEKLTVGSTGAGSAIHLSDSMFQDSTGIKLTHIPYKGVAPLITALLAGEVDVGFPTIGSVAPMIVDKRLRALGMTGAKRSNLLPDVPTIAELGIKNYSFESWFALLAPAGVPSEIIQKLNKEIEKAIYSDDVKTFFDKNGIAQVVYSSDESQRIAERDYHEFGKLLKDISPN